MRCMMDSTTNTTMNKWYRSRNFYRAIHNKRLTMGTILVFVILIFAVFAPLIAPEEIR